MAHDKFFGICENKCLVEITPESVGASEKDHTHTAEEVGAAPAEHTHTPEEIGAATADHEHTELNNRVAAIETTIGTLNDNLEVVLNGE